MVSRDDAVQAAGDAVLAALCEWYEGDTRDVAGEAAVRAVWPLAYAAGLTAAAEAVEARCREEWHEVYTDNGEEHPTVCDTCYATVRVIRGPIETGDES